MRESKHSEKNTKKSFWKDKKNIAIVVLSFFLIISFGDSPSQDTTKLNNEINSLEEQVKSLSRELEEKNSENNSLEIEELQKQIQDKDTHINNLENQINSLNEEKTNLNSKITELTEENNNLQAYKTSSASSSKTQTTSTSKVYAEPTNTSYTVYITNSGEKYHRDGCRYLKNSKIAIDKSSAISQGYTACSVCNP